MVFGELVEFVDTISKGNEVQIAVYILRTSPPQEKRYVHNNLVLDLTSRNAQSHYGT